MYVHTFAAVVIGSNVCANTGVHIPDNLVCSK